VGEARHLFANPPECDVPQPDAPNLLYFGPGIHEVSHVVVSNNQTVYVAGGAVVRGRLLVAGDVKTNAFVRTVTIRP